MRVVVEKRCCRSWVDEDAVELVFLLLITLRPFLMRMLMDLEYSFDPVSTLGIINCLTHW